MSAAAGQWVFASYADQTASLLVNLGASTVDAGTLGIDQLVGIRGVAMFGNFADTLLGTTADELFAPERGADSVAGGGGFDIVAYFDATTGVRVDLATGRATDDGGSVDTITGIEGIFGSRGDDTLTGGAEDNVFAPGQGADSIDGGLGFDILDYGLGASLTVPSDNVGNNTLAQPVAVDLLAGSATDSGGSTDAFRNIEGARGGGLADTLRGSEAGNLLAGHGGNDALDGRGGADTLDGGAGADTMDGGNGDDTYVVDDTGDRVIEAVGGGADHVFSSVSFSLSGQSAENLTLTAVAAINGTGNGLANVIVGSGAANLLQGLGGADTLDGGLGADTLEGGTGNDVYVVDNAGDRVIEESGAGTDLVQSSVSFNLTGQAIENLTLTGGATINGTGNELANLILGNGAANLLQGLGGADTLDGGLGADTLEGGTGNDVYVVDDAGDVVIEALGGGTDLALSSVSFTLTGQAIENLTLTGAAATSGTGNELANRILGNGAANVIDGAVGADTMEGGNGNDTYVVDNAGDRVIEVAGAGIDLVQSSASFNLTGQAIENLTLTGGSAISGTGNELANRITGNGAANMIDGGVGADTMEGGNGNDTYVVDNVGDRVIEAAGAGTDHVLSSVSFNLTGQNAENLTLIGVAAINGTGNGLANLIVGNGAANLLQGGTGGADTLDGGMGADTLDGGTGNDVYVVGDTGDRVIEATGAGTDHVLSSVSFSLIGQSIENLTLTDGSAIGGTGNELANRILGNAAANLLDGGAGADTMQGGNGNDTYVVDHAGDRVIEAAGAGTDHVLSSVSFNLTGQAIESLTLTGGAAINGTGNGLANRITGNDAANLLQGGTGGADTLDGGLGADTLTGGTGPDAFLFTSAFGGSNIDHITDFSVPDDHILLSAAIFMGLPTGTLAASAFVIGPTAGDAFDRIIYNSTTGALLYDADGNGGGAAVQFARLNSGLSLTAADFIVL